MRSISANITKKVQHITYSVTFFSKIVPLMR